MQINVDDIYKTSSNLHLDKFKTFCEYLFPDFKRNKCSYHEFDCLIKLISGSIEFDTLHIFIEIVGKKKKYLTYSRFRISFNLHRGNKDKSPEVKRFFNHIFESVMKVKIN